MTEAHLKTSNEVDARLQIFLASELHCLCTAFLNATARLYPSPAFFPLRCLSITSFRCCSFCKTCTEPFFHTCFFLFFLELLQHVRAVIKVIFLRNITELGHLYHRFLRDIPS